MLPIFAYCLVKANITNMYSKLKFLEDFSDEDVMRSSLGYAIATLQTVVDSIVKNPFAMDEYIMQFKQENDDDSANSSGLASLTSSLPQQQPPAMNLIDFANEQRSSVQEMREQQA